MAAVLAAIAGILTGCVLVATNAHSQSVLTRAAHIAGDIMLNMTGTAAFNELRHSTCGNENAKAQLGQTVTRALDCPGVPDSGNASSATAGGAASPATPGAKMPTVTTGTNVPPAAVGVFSSPRPAPPSFPESSPPIETAQGMWTTRDPASCSTRYYFWTVAGTIGMSEFRDIWGRST